MAATKDLTVARKSLVASLGENSKIYFEKMKLWFQMKTTKEEFDAEARAIISKDQVHLHNEFLLCLFNKVQGLAESSIPRPVKVNNVHADRDKVLKEKRLRLKRKYKTDKSNFEPADMYVEVLGQTSSPVGDEPIGANRSSAQDLVLPDRTFVLARLMLAAWENNMDGADENTAHIIIAAMQGFLKNLLTAILTRRKGYALRDGSFIYNIGEPVPSSWKRNTMYIPRGPEYRHILLDTMVRQAAAITSGALSVGVANDLTAAHEFALLFEISTMSEKIGAPTNVIDPDGQMPSMKRNIEEAEQVTAFAMACASQTIVPTKPPVNVNELLQTLKTYKNLMSNHTIYATNMERLHTYTTHPTWEDLDARKLLCQISGT